MKRKTIIILSLISAIFSIVYVILSNYGLLRYAYIHMHSVEYYTKNYKKLLNIGDNRIIISINNVYSDEKDIIKNTEKTLKSLLDQTVKVDLISIVLPKSIKNIPNNIKDSIKFINCSIDNKDLNCIISSINREQESNTRIIILSNDTIYGKDFLEELLLTSDKNKNSIVYNNKTDSIDINKGVVFYSDFFGKDFFNIKSNPKYHINSYFKNFPKVRINYTENYKIL